MPGRVSGMVRTSAPTQNRGGSESAYGGDKASATVYFILYTVKLNNIFSLKVTSPRQGTLLSLLQHFGLFFGLLGLFDCLGSSTLSLNVNRTAVSSVRGFKI